MSIMSNIARWPGDPKILKTGPSSLGAADRLAKSLGWFSIGLGLTELLAAKRLTRMLGMEGKEGLVRACGLREIGHSVGALSISKVPALWSRVAGDALDLAVLAAAYRRDNPKRRNVAIAVAAVAGVALVDLLCVQALQARHGRRGEARDYSDRSGWPHGLAQSRAAAKDFETPTDMRATPQPPAEERKHAPRADTMH